MNRATILEWLRENDTARLQALWQQADALRREEVGNAVHLRGLIEFSNCCVRQCTYCGLRAGNTELPRYRLSAEQILECAHQTVALGYGTVVLQSGEDPELDPTWMYRVIDRIKQETNLAITLSLGERSVAELESWRQAGADRYLLRFETSNPTLFRRIHPPAKGKDCDRLLLLSTLRELGYEVGSGVMIGVPGQSYDDLASDLLLFAQIDLDMIGVGPYIAHPQTPLGREPARFPFPTEDQVPNTEEMTYKVIALTRLLCPQANIPSTTALATINPVNGREKGLQRGANVVMPNVTPNEERLAYEIYPNKACVRDAAAKCKSCLQKRITGLGRTIGKGPGSSPNFQIRTFST